MGDLTSSGIALARGNPPSSRPLFGYLKPWDGRVFFRGEDISGRDAHEVKALEDFHRGYALERGNNRFEGNAKGMLENGEVRRLYLGGQPPSASLTSPQLRGYTPIIVQITRYQRMFAPPAPQTPQTGIFCDFFKIISLPQEEHL
jgi:hypothetical protein